MTSYSEDGQPMNISVNQFQSDGTIVSLKERISGTILKSDKKFQGRLFKSVVIYSLLSNVLLYLDNIRRDNLRYIIVDMFTNKVLRFEIL